MTVDTFQRLDPVPTATRIGQATAVEQSRAVAEVAAAVQVAQANPRSMERAKAEMRRSCAEYTMAARSFYSYKRAGSTVTGPTVALARELKRCFGNFQSGMAELRRDDGHGQSEMQAWAWDVETNARSVTVFVVPHENYMTGKTLDALRDVYENNANQGARREREMILGLLPQWYVEEAITAARATLERGPTGEPLSVRQDKAELVLRSLGISLDRIERRVGREKSQWTPQDLADLTVDYHSIKRGEIVAEDRFPVADLTVEDIAPPPVKRAAPEAPPAESSERQLVMPVSKGRIDSIRDQFVVIGVGGKRPSPAEQEQRVRVVNAIIPRPTPVDDLRDLTRDEGELVADNLAGDAGRRLCAQVLDRPDLLPYEPPVADEQLSDPTTEPGWTGGEQ